MRSDATCRNMRHVTAEELAAAPLSDRIAYVVKTYGPTQEKFAQKLGTSRERVNAWANGRSEPGDEYAAAIATISGLPVALFAAAPEAAAARRLAATLSVLVPAAEAAAERLERALAAANGQ